MKRKLVFGVASCFLMGAGIVFADADKVLVCHATGSGTNAYIQIDVSENAMPAHLEHGDFVVTDENPCLSDTGGGNGGDPGGDQ